MESQFDIDLSGEEEDLPPGVVPGSLSGTDEAPEPPTPIEPSADEIAEAREAASPELDAEFDAALGGDDDDWRPEPDDPEPPEPDPEPEAAVEAPPAPEPETQEEGSGGEPPDPPEAPPTPVDPEDKLETGAEQDAKPSQENPAPKPKPRAKAKRAPKPKPRARAATPATGNASGTVARLYYIFSKTQAEVDGQITEVYVRCTFVDEGGQAIEGIRARNREGALMKAGRLFGHGFEGRLVATPEGMWEERDVRNKPREEFKVEIG